MIPTALEALKEQIESELNELLLTTGGPLFAQAKAQFLERAAGLLTAVVSSPESADVEVDERLICQLRVQWSDPDCTGWTCPQCGRSVNYKPDTECDECGLDIRSFIRDVEGAVVSPSGRAQGVPARGARATGRRLRAGRVDLEACLMPIYIATVYHLSSRAEAVEGDAGITRRVVRRNAVDEADFKAIVRDEWIHDVDAGVWFGPIGLAKDQGRR